MAALSAGAAFAIYEARQSWVARKSSAGEFRLRCTLDFMRFVFALVCVMGLVAMGIMHRIGNRSPHAVAIFAVLFAVAYLAVISIQIRLGYWLGSTRDKSRHVGFC
jgi:Na+/alanine symporter